MSTPAYPFDPTAILPANKISNELCTVTIANAINAFVIVPDAAPFYGESLVIVNSSGRALVENVDYYLTHRWKQASDHTGKNVYGTITLLVGYAPDNYRLNYQTIGGEYVTAPANAIQNGLVALNSSYILLDWSTAPTAFPAIPHTEELSGINGMTQIYQALYSIASAIKSPATGVHYDDVEDGQNVFALGSASPFMTLIETIAMNENSHSDMIVTLLDKLQQIKLTDNTPKNLQHYSIPLMGGFILKVGKAIFPRNGEPDRLTFVGNPFPNQCLHADATLAMVDPAQPATRDRLYLGSPSKVGMDIRIDYETSGFLTEWFAGTDLPAPTRDHNIVTLPDGRLLVTGGISAGGATFYNTTYFGTVKGDLVTWVAGTPMPYAVCDHKTIVLPDGRLMVAGGNSNSVVVNSLYFGTISGNTISWAAGTALPGTYDESQIVVLPDGRLFVAGGIFNGAHSTNTYFGTISGNNITWVAGSPLPYTTSDHTMSLLSDGRVVVIGGYGLDTTSNPRNLVTFGTISGNVITWATGTPLPITAWEHQTVVLPDGRLFVAGGASGLPTSVGGIVNAYIGAVSGNTVLWTSASPLPIAVFGNEITLLNDGTIVTTGGYSDTVGAFKQTFLGRMPYTTVGNRQLTYFALGN